MLLLDRLKVTVVGGGSAPPPAAPARTTVRFPSQDEIAARFGRPPVGWSDDLRRILALPRRNLETEYSPAAVTKLEARLRSGGSCRCAEFRPALAGQPQQHCDHLLPVQAQALLEAVRANGLAGAIGVGHGKTLLDLLLPLVMPQCRVAVLLIPPNLRTQLLERDWHYYGGHWKLPNLVGGRWAIPGRPWLHVLSHSQLSSKKSSALLKQISPDLIIVDEAHGLKDPKSARTRRYARQLEERPGTRSCLLTGTLLTRSIKDGAHLVEAALGESSPFPLHPKVVEQWGTALDPAEVIAPPGALQALVDVAPDVANIREAFATRCQQTLGFVSTEQASIDIPLVISTRDPGPVPPALLGHLETARGGERPDGEQFQEKLQAVACARQLSSGFFYRWRYPRGEPPELIEKWFSRRKAWNKEVWQELRHAREHLDSPGLLEDAARRYHGDLPRVDGLPLWGADSWPEWRDIAEQVQPVPQMVWLDEYLIRDAAAFAREAPGIIWVEYPEFGERVAKAAGVPYYGGGQDAGAALITERGDRSVVASIKAHGTGKNLQMFARQLVAQPPVDGWEQMLGRTHRQGQQADQVEVWVYRHTAEYGKAFAKACELARFAQEIRGEPQRLCSAVYTW